MSRPKFSEFSVDLNSGRLVNELSYLSKKARKKGYLSRNPLNKYKCIYRWHQIVSTWHYLDCGKMHNIYGIDGKQIVITSYIRCHSLYLNMASCNISPDTLYESIDFTTENIDARNNDRMLFLHHQNRV